MKVLTSLNKCQWKRKENLWCCRSFIGLKLFCYFSALDDEYQCESKTRSERFVFCSNGSSVLCLVLLLSKRPLWLGWASFLACASDARRDLKLFLAPVLSGSQWSCSVACMYQHLVELVLLVLIWHSLSSLSGHRASGHRSCMLTIVPAVRSSCALAVKTFSLGRPSHVAAHSLSLWRACQTASWCCYHAISSLS